ncbi:ABC transporter substrate-binding protein [Actinotalea sp. M2MS4P-6]|uniref:ABC transporter substrate-binding protein n=1 Tax=Actinotalea sp. M2MS4P-6 TaxID=2983762 RepID=UPI0021E3F46E|nr:ABC transporter substrate-binding protein [Actinotalea sp. M2MS4P-6]MCV2394318.1 ABC transporter substrate-binding protein [Actinotalea sp. M2MS4P-6]
MRFRRSGAALAAAGVLALAACGSSSDGSSTDASSDGGTAASGEVVELTLETGFTGGDRSAYEGLVQTFNDTHPDIQVTMDVQPWDSIAQTLPAAWGTGQAPDVATPNFDPNVAAEYVQNGSVLPLDSYVGSGADQIDADSLAPAAIKVFTVDDALYAIPANVATLQLYYNKDLFEAAGIAEPPTTADDFRADAVALTDAANGIYGLALADHETIQMWPVLQWMDGGDIVGDDNCAAIDSDASVATLTQWANLVIDDGISPVGLTGAEADSLFAAGKAAMEINGPWAAGSYTEAGVNFGVASIPVGSAGPVTLASTVPMMIANGTEHPDEAAAFLAWWTSADAQRQFALASGFPPVRTDMADDPELAANEVVQSFAAALPSARLYLPGVPNATQVDSDVYVPLIGEITRGADVATKAAAAAEAINALTGCTN